MPLPMKASPGARGLNSTRLYSAREAKKRQNMLPSHHVSSNGGGREELSTDIGGGVTKGEPQHHDKADGHQQHQQHHSLFHTYLCTCLKNSYPLIPLLTRQLFQSSQSQLSTEQPASTAAVIPHLYLDLACITKSQYHAFESSIKAHSTKYQNDVSAKVAQSPKFQRISLVWNGDASKDYGMWRETPVPQQKKSGMGRASSAKAMSGAKKPKATASTADKDVTLDTSIAQTIQEMTMTVGSNNEIVRQFDWVKSTRAAQRKSKGAAASAGHQRGKAKGSTKSSTKEFFADMDVSSATRLANLLASHLITSSLTSLRLEGFPETFNAQVWKIICGALKSKCASSLRELSIARTTIGDDSFRPLGAVLKHLKCLEHLNFSACRLTSGSVRYLVNVIKMHQEIGITDQWIGSLRGAPEPGDDAYDSGIRGLFSLDLSNNFLTDQACKMLSSSLTEDSKLRVLNLNGNLIGENGIAIMDDFLIRSTVSQLQMLRLGDNPGTIAYVEKLNNSGVKMSALSSLTCGSSQLCFMRASPSSRQARGNGLSSIDTQPVKRNVTKTTGRRKSAAARGTEAENAENENPNIVPTLSRAAQSQINELQGALQSQQEENQQLREIIKGMYQRMKGIKEKEKMRRHKQEKRRGQKIENMDHKSPVQEHAERPSESTAAVTNRQQRQHKQRPPSSTPPQPPPRTFHKIPTQKVSESINTDPDDSINYEGLTLAEIERELEQVDRNEMPQYDVVLTLAKSVKQLTRMVDDLEGSMTYEEQEEDITTDDEHGHLITDRRDGATTDAGDEEELSGIEDFTAAALQRAAEVFGRGE